MRAIFFLYFTLIGSLIKAQDLPPKAAYPLTVKQIHSGHSLTDPLFNPWPGVYVELVTQQTGQWALDHIGKSTIPGSPMSWRWDYPPCCDVPDARHDIGDWEVLVITERVPLYYEGGSTDVWYLQGLTEQRAMLSTWVNHSWQNGNDGNGAPTLLWSTWTNIDDSDGPWRSMLDVLGTEWENMQDYANANLLTGATPVYMIPGHKMMARLYDDIQAGIVPDVTHISEFFSDNIHVSDIGTYAVALIHYACIFNESPVGLPYDLLDNVTPPTPALAAYLQQMIWEVVTSYPRTGLYDVLSIHETNLKAKLEHQKTNIQFSIPLLDPIARIELQHSTSMNTRFETIQEFPVLSDNHFTYTHQTPLAGSNFYRVKITDVIGQISYSKVQSVNVVAKIWEIFPNPVHNQLFIRSHNIHFGHYVLTDLNGHKLQSGNISAFILLKDLPQGTYLIKLYTDRTTETHRVVVR